mgnify:CR=1 FL=1
MRNDNAYIEPAHLLAAMLRQDDGPRALLERAGVNVPGLAQAAEAAIKKLPQVQGHDIVQVGPELGKLLQATEKEALKRGDQFIASELFLLALTDKIPGVVFQPVTDFPYSWIMRQDFPVDLIRITVAVLGAQARKETGKQQEGKGQ